MKRRQQHTRGVTLMELLVVVAIIGILALISLPNIPGIIAQNRIRSAANDLMSKLRTVRSLAISKGRPIEVEFTIKNPTNPGDRNKAYYFTATKQAYIEYNLLAKLDDKDFNQNVVEGKIKDIETDLADDGVLDNKYRPMILFTEAEEPLHLMPRWHNDGTPDYRVAINYDIQSAAGRESGIYCMSLHSAMGEDCIQDMGASANLKITFSPSGTIEPNRVIVMDGHPKYTGGYQIVLYKGGQIRIFEKK